MKLLVFADSVGAGQGMVDTGRRWPLLVEDRIRARLEGPVELVESRFVVIAPGSAAFAERKLAAIDPDIVILPVGTYGVIMRSVAARVGNLFGMRARRWTTSAERWLDGKAVGADVARGPRRILFRSARSAAQKVIGTAPLSTPEEIFDAYRATFAVLARRENTHVICVHFNSSNARSRQASEGGQKSNWDRLYDKYPELVSVRDALQARIRAEVEARHFSQLVFSEYKQRTGRAGIPENGDNVRVGDEGHEVFAEMVIEKLEELLALPPRPAVRAEPG